MSTTTVKSEKDFCSANKAISNWWNDIERFGFRHAEDNDDDVAVAGSFTVADPFREVNNRGCLQGEREVEINGGEFVLSGRWRRSRRVGRGEISGPGLGGVIRFISGSYSDGWLEGKGKAFLDDGLILEGHFQKGRLTGPVTGVDSVGRLALIGNFRQGMAVGPFWRRLEGDGFLYGQLDEKCRFSGEENAYLFSDLETALCGKYADDALVVGTECRVMGMRIVDDIMELKFSEPSGPQFRHWPSTLCEIPCPPLQEDPFEKKWVEVRPSMINGAGDGLFAKRRMSAGSTVAFYNGIRVRPGEEPPFRSINYEIYVDWTHVPGAKSDYMDLPDEYTLVDNYRASLGHKINHSFNPNCKWDTAIHPVFGRIPRIVSLRTVEPEEELTCHYMVDMQEAGSNEHLSWYVTQWQQSTNENNKAKS